MDFNKQQNVEHSSTFSSFNISSDDSLLFYSNNPELMRVNNELLSSSKNNQSQAIELTLAATQKYHDEPLFAYHLEKTYLDNDNQDLAHQIAENNYRKFPLYLLTRCRYALVCLSANKLLEAASAVGYTFDLQALYPKRSAFHFIEIVTFYAFVVQYFCALKDFNRAASYIAELMTIDKNLPIISQLRHTVLLEALEQNLSAKNIALLFSRGAGEDDEDIE